VLPVDIRMDMPADEAYQFCDRNEGTTAGEKIQACIDALPSSGGIADARLIQGEQTAPSTITINKPVMLMLGEISLAVTASPAINITSRTGFVSIYGLPGKTVLTGARLLSGKNTRTGMIWADYSETTQATDILVDGLTLIGGSSNSLNYKVGVMFANVSHGAIRNNSMTLIDSPEGWGGDAYNILVRESATYIDVENNSITMQKPAVIGSSPFKIGILLQSPMVSPSNGLYEGINPAQPTTMHINVRNNFVSGGTHGINLQNVAWVNISDNYAQLQGHRNLILSGWTNHHITVTGNVFYRAGSCNVIGSGYQVTVTGNVMDTTLGGEGNNIEIYYGPEDWLIAHNFMTGASTSGVRIGYKAKRINVSQNYIENFSSRSVDGYAGVKIEGAMSARYPNLIPGGGSIEDVTVTENVITNFYGDGQIRRGIYLLRKEAGSLQGDTPFRRVQIADNTLRNVDYGVVLAKQGNTAEWRVSIGFNRMEGVITPYRSDYLDVTIGRRGEWRTLPHRNALRCRDAKFVTNISRCAP
jgi:hypothetical protein